MINFAATMEAPRPLWNPFGALRRTVENFTGGLIKRAQRISAWVNEPEAGDSYQEYRKCISQRRFYDAVKIEKNIFDLKEIALQNGGDWRRYDRQLSWIYDYDCQIGLGRKIIPNFN